MNYEQIERWLMPTLFAGAFVCSLMAKQWCTAIWVVNAIMWYLMREKNSGAQPKRTFMSKTEMELARIRIALEIVTKSLKTDTPRGSTKRDTTTTKGKRM